eukprot:1865887-Amphidinium_carterae.1
MTHKPNAQENNPPTGTSNRAYLRDSARFVGRGGNGWQCFAMLLQTSGMFKTLTILIASVTMMC